MQTSFQIPNSQGSGWTLYRQVTGPRGGKKWLKIAHEAATGSDFSIDLGPGLYKEIWYNNNWPVKRLTEVKE